MASTMQLEFSQAMSDFKKMFPEMDSDVIEVVLRANQGAVDATIDQLLAMSTDNQNERLRNELENSGTSSPSRNNFLKNNLTSNYNDEQQHHNQQQQQGQLIDTSEEPPKTILGITPVQAYAVAGGGNIVDDIGFLTNITGASPKFKKPIISTQLGVTAAATTSVPITTTTITNQLSEIGKSKWNPPLLGPLPANFLRLTGIEGRTDFDLPDEQFALMLQNEEFMNELRWNKEFMTALEKEQQDKSEDEIAFKERVRHMGKVSRKKFLQVARVFTWQRNKKTTSAKQIDSLPLKEEHSDDDDHHHNQSHHGTVKK